MNSGPKTKIEKDMERRLGRELSQSEINAAIMAKLRIPAGQGKKKNKRAIRAAIYKAE